MTVSEAACRWRSASDSSGWGLEFFENASPASDVAHPLIRKPNQAGDNDPRFLLVHSQGQGSDLTDRAIAMASAAWHSSKVCLVVDRAQLDSVDIARLHAGNVSVMLDDVDGSTRIADLVDERIDAIRFTADFVRQAAASLRLACLLEAMLRLAGDVGLTSFGPSRYADGRRLPTEFAFDYIESGATQDGVPAP